MTERVAVSAIPRLDVFLMLYRNGALVDGAISRWVWPLPAFPLTLTARCQNHRLFLRINDGPEISATITAVPATLGNTCPYLACPECKRQVRYLYVHNNRIACRRCQDLAFPSRQPGQWRTTSRQIARLRAQLVSLEARALDERSKKRQSPRLIQDVVP
jgi:hypothetical protein